MKRKVEHVERISYTITEAEVLRLIREHSYELAGRDKIGPVFSTHTLYPTTINRLDVGGYEIVTEYVTQALAASGERVHEHRAGCRARHDSEGLVAILKHCMECLKLIHPSFGLYCSVECEEVCEAARLLRRDGVDRIIDAIEDISTVQVKVPPVHYIQLNVELSI